MKRDIKVIAFFGSPRRNGNTELLLKETARGIEEKGGTLKTYNLNLMKIRACQDCGGCNETGRCIIEDDMVSVYQDIREANRIILASPVFFFSLSAQIKLMIDRCQSFWCEKYLLNRTIEEDRFGRKGLLLLVGGMKKDVGIQCSEACAKAFFRTVSVPSHETLYYLGIDQKGDILHHPSALREAYEAGTRLMEER